jgi:alkanesulfonate monooxygenase SsuD/methylene tetrahydromethanopterin reductase-like flavin-dependent oxidoreductase (luciferase family)/predicted kinase
VNLAGIEEPFVVVLVGAAGSGKSAWAAHRFRRTEIVSSDDLRAVVGTGDADLDATKDVFAALDLIVAARTRRRLTTVVDTLGLDPVRRRGYLEGARAAGLPVIAVLMDTDPGLCRARNRTRDRPVPAPALASQLRRMADVAVEVETEGFSAVVHVVGADEPVPAPIAPELDRPAGGLRFVLQVSRFPWGTDPVAWLASVATAADEAGFAGLALMDHLIQIPQVGRAWEPIPEPWVTLGLLAGLPTSLELGTLVSPASMHLPGRLAKAAATLDVLTGGRAFCGVGAGWWEREHAAYGLPFRSGTQRIADLQRCLEMLRALWSPGTKPYRGESLDLPETTLYPRPVGPLPIVVGGRGPRLLALAARLGDACNVPASHVEQARAVMGDKPVTVLDVPVLGRDREHTAQLVERLRGRTFTAAYARQHHAGAAADHVARYRDLAERGVSSVFVAPADLGGADEVQRFAPVIAAFS